MVALRCSTCEAELPADSSDGECPRCLFQLGLETVGDLAFDEADLNDAFPEIANYRMLRLLGEGGFGIVYLAEQIRPVRRQVALKVIKPGMDTRSVIARFSAERQALAMMEHPSIAKVL